MTLKGGDPSANIKMTLIKKIVWKRLLRFAILYKSRFLVGVGYILPTMI